MKNHKTVFLLLLFFAFYTSNAQVAEQQIKKLPSDPKTNCQLRYYYFPNLEAYFDNLENVYYYQSGGNWNIVKELPENYGGYSLYKNVRVMLNDFDGENPYQFIKTHKKTYPYSSNGKIKKVTACNN